MAKRGKEEKNIEDQNVMPKKKFGAGKTTVAIILILVLGGIAIVSILRDRIVNYQQNQVAVSGQGKVTYQPDLATIVLGVQVDKAVKPEDALNQLNNKIKNIVAAVKGQGIAPEDIVTQNYFLSPQYDYVNNVSTVGGYTANQQISVKIRDLQKNSDKVSQVLAEAGKAGANQVLGITFNVSNLEDLKQQARALAIADANTKAVKLARVAGVRLGKIVGWWENYVQGPGQGSSYYADGKGGASGIGGGASYSSPTIPSGSQEIIVEMNLNYRIK